MDVIAPEQAILTTDSGPDSDYAAASGTSYASSLAAGLCTLICSARPYLAPGDGELILKQGADDIGAPGVDDVFEYGRINVRESLRMIGIAVPAVDPSATTTSGLSPLAVDFLDQTTGVPTSWFWNFGDGASSTQQYPTRTYTTQGLYIAILEVFNALGDDDCLELEDYTLVQ